MSSCIYLHESFWRCNPEARHDWICQHKAPTLSTMASIKQKSRLCTTKPNCGPCNHGDDENVADAYVDNGEDEDDESEDEMNMMRPCHVPLLSQRLCISIFFLFIIIIIIVAIHTSLSTETAKPNTPMKHTAKDAQYILGLCYCQVSVDDDSDVRLGSITGSINSTET